MSVPEDIRWKLELYAFRTWRVVRHWVLRKTVLPVAVKFHPHVFSLASMFAEEVFHKSGIEVELRPSLIDGIIEPDNGLVVQQFYAEVKRFAQEHGGPASSSRATWASGWPRHR